MGMDGNEKFQTSKLIGSLDCMVISFSIFAKKIGKFDIQKQRCLLLQNTRLMSILINLDRYMLVGKMLCIILYLDYRLTILILLDIYNNIFIYWTNIRERRGPQIFLWERFFFSCKNYSLYAYCYNGEIDFLCLLPLKMSFYQLENSTGNNVYHNFDIFISNSQSSVSGRL